MDWLCTVEFIPDDDVVGNALGDGLQKSSGASRKQSLNFNECGDYLAPTEGWSDRSQNCLNDMRIVGNT